MNLRRFHRWHALAMSLIVITSAFSGLVHTWMSLTQSPPPPARPAAAVDLAAVTVTPAQVTEALGGISIASLALRPIAGHPFWQAVPASGPPRWVDGVSGQEDPTADARYAEGIARGALGRETVRKAAYLTAFDQEYIAIFRLLPVYRFEADDGRGTRVYVSTLTGSVARLTDDRRQWEADLFSYAHKWNFLPRPWRDWALIAAMGSLVALAAVGLILFARTRRPART